MVDKRAFLEGHRNKICRTLEDLGVTWTFKTADVKRMVDEMRK